MSGHILAETIGFDPRRYAVRKDQVSCLVEHSGGFTLICIKGTDRQFQWDKPFDEAVEEVFGGG